MTDDLIERTARIIAPSSWAVMDSYLEQTKRKYAGQNVGWPADQYQHKESMAIARAAIAIIAPAVLDMAAGVAKSESNGRRLSMENAKAGGRRSEARDFESMMLQAVFIETAILALKAQFEGDKV